MEKRKKIIVTDKQISFLAENEIKKIKKEDIEDYIGDPDDRRIEYPSREDLIDKEAEADPNNKNKINTDDMKSPPHELLSYLEKVEEAKSILSKIAARETNEQIKNRIYSHYEKAQKLAFELIKEFGIVH